MDRSEVGQAQACGTAAAQHVLRFPAGLVQTTAWLHEYAVRKAKVHAVHMTPSLLVS